MNKTSFLTLAEKVRTHVGVDLSERATGKGAKVIFEAFRERDWGFEEGGKGACVILLDFDHFSDLLFKGFPALFEGEYEGG